MSWEFVEVGAASQVTTGGLTVNIPTTRLPGDLLVACIAGRGNAAFAAPVGWEIIEQIAAGDTGSNGAATNAAMGLMAYRIFESGDVSPTFARSGGDAGYSRIVCYRHTSAITTGNSGIEQPAAGAATITLAAGIDTTTANELIVACLCGGDNDFSLGFTATDPSTPSGASDTSTQPTGAWIKRSDNTTTAGADASLAIADAVKTTPGNTGPISATHARNRRHVLIAAAFRAGASERPRSRLILTPW